MAAAGARKDAFVDLRERAQLRAACWQVRDMVAVGCEALDVWMLNSRGRVVEQIH
jgi:hypothetical protein